MTDSYPDPYPRIVVLVPRRVDHGARDTLWAHVREIWMQETLWPVIEGHHPQPWELPMRWEPFNRSLAINTAARDAGEWDVAIIADADTIPTIRNAHDGACLAQVTGNLTICHNRWNGLTSDGTLKAVGGAPPEQWRRHRRLMVRNGLSSCIAITRALWDRVGGFDEAFVGWGFEDHAFARACELATGRIERIPGDVWHLWHPISPDRDHTNRNYQANQDRLARYQQATTLDEIGQLCEQ